jgi:DNA-binding NarL/FixJ family response regulator
MLYIMRKLLLVDDSAAFRGLLKWYLGTLPGITVVAEASDGREALEQVTRTNPDLVLMDVRMPTMDGLEATRQLRARGGQARILLLTAHGDAIPPWLVSEVGANGMIDKADLGERLREAVISDPTSAEVDMGGDS